MNSFSNFGSMLGRGSQNVNSISYINRYAKKNIKFDFSGSSFSDLSYNPYAVTSAGLNMINGNTTIARLKLNNDYLKSTDFTSSSFTIYLKHAARYSNATPFNFQYPSAVTVSNAVVLSGSDFSANFYSLLDPGSPLPYVFSGCTTTELNGTSLTGTVTAPYGTVTKTFTRANYAIFPTVVPQSLTISCGAPLPVTTYAVTVSGDGLFYINDLRQLPTMTAGNVYLFDQSNNTNIGNTLVFGTTLDSPSYYTTGVFTNGTAGNTGAYTLLNYTNTTLGGLNFYSRQNSGMGLGYPGIPTITSTTAGDSSVSVTVTAPTSTGGSPITSYSVIAATKSGDVYTQISSTVGLTITGLTNGTAYYFSVAATNIFGTGAYSAYSNLTTPDIPTVTYYVKVVGTNFALSTTPAGTYTNNLAITRLNTYNSDGSYNFTYGDTMAATVTTRIKYIFDQTHNSNLNKLLVFKTSGGNITPAAGTTYGGTYTSSFLTYTGTAGSTGLTSFIVTDVNTPDLYYTTATGAVLGGKFKRGYSFHTTYFTSGTRYYRVHMALESSSNLVLNVPSGTAINYLLVGGGGSGCKGAGSGTGQNPGSGGGGGRNISGQYITNSLENYKMNIAVGNGGSYSDTGTGTSGSSSVLKAYNSSGTTLLSETASGGLLATLTLGKLGCGGSSDLTVDPQYRDPNGFNGNTTIIIGSNICNYFNNKNPYIGSNTSYAFNYNGYNNASSTSTHLTNPMLVNDWWGSGLGNGRLGGGGYHGGERFPDNWLSLPAGNNHTSSAEQASNPCEGGGGFGAALVGNFVSPNYPRLMQRGGVPYTGGGGGGDVDYTYNLAYPGGCGTCFLWYEVPSIYVLKTSGYTIRELYTAGYKVSDLRIAYTITEINSSGYYTLSNLIEAGYTASELYTVSYTYSMLLNNPSITQLLVTEIMTGSELQPAMTIAQISYSVGGGPMSDASLNAISFYTNSNLKRAITNWTTLTVKPSTSDPSHVSNFNTVFCTSFRYVADSTTFNEDISRWNTSNVTDFYGAFYNCPNFNSNISGWDTSKGTTFFGAFYNCRNFNSPLNWVVSSCTDSTSFTSMFENCSSLDQAASIRLWVVPNLGTLQNMFRGATKMIDPNATYYFPVSPTYLDFNKSP